MTPAILRTMGPGEWALLFTLSIIWGGSFFFFAIALTGLPTFTIVLLRVGIGTLALWALVMMSGLAAPCAAGTWRDFLIMGCINNAIPFSLIVWGQHEIAPGLAAILNATTPFFAVLLAHRFTADEPMSWLRLSGALAGLGGVAVMMGVDTLAGGGSLPHRLAIVAAAVCYAMASVFGRRFAGQPPLITAAGQTTGSSLLLLPLVLTVDQPWRLEMPGFQVWLAVAGLGLICTSLAYVMYFTILKRAGATNLVLVTFLVPVSAVLLGVAFLGETLGFQHVLGMAAIGLGLALIDGRLPAMLSRRA